MRPRDIRPRRAQLALLLCLLFLPACATSHLVRWSRGENSIFSQPNEEVAPYVHPAGVVLAIPITFVWDVVTFPFQWFWDVYPYGNDLRPDEEVKVAGT